MAKPASGHSLSAKDIPILLAMDARGDRDHDIAAWFGVNQGRIAEAKAGKFGTPALATTGLPPAGAPGIKGQRLRDAVNQALSAKDLASVTAILKGACADYDRNEA